MLPVSNRFDQLATGDVRPVSWAFSMAPDKRLLFGVDFFILDFSQLDGSDLLAPTDSNVLAEWDKYQYYDYSKRVIRMEWSREENVPYSASLAMADIVLQNTDGFFNYGPRAKWESFYENFNQPLDMGLWYDWSIGQAQLVSGQLHIASKATEGYFGLHTIYNYDLTDSFIHCQLVDAGDQDTPSFFVYPISLDIDLDNSIQIYVSDGRIISNKRVSTVYAELANIAYDPDVHKWFRIRESGGTTFWEYSTDSESWTGMHSEANPIDVTALELNIFVGSIESGTALVDESMATDPATGDKKGDATWIATGGGYMRFNEAVSFTAGQFEYTQDLEQDFEMTCDFWAGGGTGADSCYFYWGAFATPIEEGSAEGNYAVVLNEFSDAIELRFDGSVITSQAFADLDNSTWRECRVKVSGNDIQVFIDGSPMIDVTDVERVLGGILFGWAGRSGGSNNEHRARNLLLELNPDVVASDATFDNINTDIDGVPVGQQQNVSPIASYMIPRRPVRLLSGFGGESVPQFVGLTERAPVRDFRSKTVSFHATDFLSFLYGRPVDQTIILEDVYTHEVFDVLFTSFGLGAGQYELDETFNKIPFVYFPKGLNFGTVANELMQAEMGRLYMDENGIIRLSNRFRSSEPPVMSFDKSNVIEHMQTDDENITNMVEIRSDVRTVQPTQPVYQLSDLNPPPEPLDLDPSGQTEYFFDFEVGGESVPVISIETITDFEANSQADGEGADLTANISLSSVELFAEAVKITFANSGASAFLTRLIINGTPAVVTRRIFKRFRDEDSIAQFEERSIEIHNNYIQDDGAAESLALSILNYYKDFNNTLKIKVKGTPALQIGDHVNIAVEEGEGEYQITKIDNILEPSSFTQWLTCKVFNIPDFFILDVSILNGEDVLAP